jgi:hypothetical protein
MKVGDLVKPKKCYAKTFNYGIGLVVKKLTKNPFIAYPDSPGETRWAVLWTNPLYTMDDGTSVQYEEELEVVGEAR